MITYKIDVSGAIDGIAKKIEALKESAVTREDALSLLNMMTERIHEDGKASDGSQIGTYSPAYMKVRTGNYGNSARFSRGAREGTAKDAGVYSRGKNKGNPRPKYNRSSDTKIIVSLTRQLENDWGVFMLNNGKGIGFHNPHNYQKLKWVEGIKKKKIGMPTEQEREFLVQRVRARVREILNS